MILRLAWLAQYFLVENRLGLWFNDSLNFVITRSLNYIRCPISVSISLQHVAVDSVGGAHFSLSATYSSWNLVIELLHTNQSSDHLVEMKYTLGYVLSSPIFCKQSYTDAVSLQIVVSTNVWQCAQLCGEFNQITVCYMYLWSCGWFRSSVRLKYMMGGITSMKVRAWWA